MNWTAYWFMFPVALGIATLANATGIEGATFFSPVLMLILRLEPRIAIGAALITEVFGFGSGVSAYMRRKLIDYRLASQFLLITVPLAAIGAYFAGQISPVILKSIFGFGLLVVGIVFLRSPAAKETAKLDEAIRADFPPDKAERKIVTADGQEICYTVCNRAEGMTVTGIGGLFMGLIGSGQRRNERLLSVAPLPSSGQSRGSDQRVRRRHHRPHGFARLRRRLCPQRRRRADASVEPGRVYRAGCDRRRSTRTGTGGPAGCAQDGAIVSGYFHRGWNHHLVDDICARTDLKLCELT